MTFEFFQKCNEKHLSDAAIKMLWDNVGPALAEKPETPNEARRLAWTARQFITVFPEYRRQEASDAA
jgi:hypothetical protein